MSARILLVEDDPALLNILQASMSFGGYQSESVTSGEAAIEAFKARPFDAVLVDLGLPDLDGGEVLKRLRDHSDVPIIVVSGRLSEDEKIKALDQGADDFVSKPFLPGELLARIRAALRRHEVQRKRVESDRDADLRDPINVGALVLDPLHRSAVWHGRQASLSEAEFKILRTLATTREGVVSKASLLRALYDSDALEETRIVEVYISNIRRKLRELHGDDCILNFRGRGWKLVIPNA